MRLEALLRSIDDLTHLSAELLSKAIEQGCWYHVNPFRSSLIRALDLPGSARILEVGCGGGALTRYLGEQGYDVVALETSEELAECARLRCRDLSNVEIVTGFVENVLVDQRFDFVVCVDPLFVESDFFDPGLHLMTLCKKVLKSTGSLILSIPNPLHAPGSAHVEPSHHLARGRGAPLRAVKQSLASAGFSSCQEYLTFPNHASPLLLIDASQARNERVSWVPIINKLYQSSEIAQSEVDSWWRSVYSEGLERSLAPGWLLIAHSHAVHSVVWNGSAVKQFSPISLNDSDAANQRKEDSLAANIKPADATAKGLSVHPICLASSKLLADVLKIIKPTVHAVRDYKDSLMAADRKIDELAESETRAREQLEDSVVALIEAEERHSSEISKEQESRRIREAELGLVLKQYHAVGAMCYDMREEGRKLRDMLDELKRRYVASEEWGKSLSQRVSDAETELEQARSWWLYRFFNGFRGALHRRNNTLRKIGKNSVDSPAL